MTDRAVLMCVPKETPNDLVVPNSTTGWCEVCATEVWIAPSGRKIQDDGAMVACIDCGVGLMATEEYVQIQTPTREQLDELKEVMSDDVEERPDL